VFQTCEGWTVYFCTDATLRVLLLNKENEMGRPRYRVLILSDPTSTHGTEFPVSIDTPESRLCLSVAEARKLSKELSKAVEKLERMAEAKESSRRDLVQRILPNGDEAQ
jgi:hypothetical protein